MASEEKKEKKAQADEPEQAAETAASAGAEENEAPEKDAGQPAPEEAPKSEADDKAAALEKQLEETKDQLLRTLAEYDNFRRRSQKEKEALYTDVKADAVSALLPAIDNFERAAAAESDFETYKKGIEMTVKQLLELLGGLGVESFGCVGDAFDPNIHNGVMHEENADLPENSVSDVFMKGYRLGDKIIRHATVKVAN